MKLFAVLFVFVSFSAFAQFPGFGKLKALAAPVIDACKDDKSKIKGCESYTEMGKVKACLLMNKEQLSDKCKTSLKFMK